MLVGTTSVKSELLSSLLAEQDIPHNLLNAKPENVERESEIVAQAVGPAPSPSPPTWPVAARTSSLAATAITWLALLREALLPRLVRPEEGHKPPVPATQWGRWLL